MCVEGAIVEEEEKWINQHGVIQQVQCWITAFDILSKVSKVHH